LNNIFVIVDIMVTIPYSIIFLHSIMYLSMFTNETVLKGLARMLKNVLSMEKIVAYDNLIYLTLVDIPLYSSSYLVLITGLRRTNILIPL